MATNNTSAKLLTASRTAMFARSFTSAPPHLSYILRVHRQIHIPAVFLFLTSSTGMLPFRPSFSFERSSFAALFDCFVPVNILCKPGNLANRKYRNIVCIITKNSLRWPLVKVLIPPVLIRFSGVFNQEHKTCPVNWISGASLVDMRNNLGLPATRSWRAPIRLRDVS